MFIISSRCHVQMVPLATVATGIDGTSATSFSFPAPDVNPYSKIYFLQFTNGGNMTGATWTTRFTIAGSDGSPTEPTNTTDFQGQPVGWGTGELLSSVSTSSSNSSSSSSSEAASTSTSVVAAAASTSVSSSSSSSSSSFSAASNSATPSASAADASSDASSDSSSDSATSSAGRLQVGLVSIFMASALGVTLI
ncbi:hypothetical protein C367_00890 [Cryptococcus neoformans Ze90-1]|nr:hypothetical protein C367_00890 [Cryptococcus neoformans var. grubii Ze90-1]